MANNEQVGSKISIKFLAILFSRPQGHLPRELIHPKSGRQTQHAATAIYLHLRNTAVIDSPDFIGAQPAVISFDKVNEEWQRQDGDYDHEPMPVGSQKCH